MVDSNSIVPIASQPHLALDVLRLLVSEVVKQDASTNFLDGTEDADATEEDLTKICLFPYYLEDKPANCGVVRTDDIDADSESPIRQALVTVVFRQPADVGEELSAQMLATQAAEATLQWLRPNGVIRTYETLESGRVVLRFWKAKITPQGEDGSHRFLAKLEFEIMYRDINVP